MSCSSRRDTRLLQRFIQAQWFRHPQTGKIYFYVLRHFQRFVAQCGQGEPPSVSVLQQWLRNRSLKWPAHMVFHRARLVERFLDWSYPGAANPNNAFAELHRLYGSETTPIVRALLSDQAEAMLEQLRPIPRFGSCLGQLLKDHVAQMRSLGYRYDTSERALLRFDRFLQQHVALAGMPLSQLIEQWCGSDPSPIHRYEAQQVGRAVSKAMNRLDPTVPIWPLDHNVVKQAYLGQRRPHVYTDEEIKRVLETASSFPSPMAPLRPLSLFVMLMLGYCAGLRISEIVGLKLGDVELQGATIEIRQTKFFKTRRLPLAPTVMAALKHYLAMRHAAGAPTSAQSALFWNQRLGKGYTRGSASILLTDVLRRAGLKPQSGAIGPRIHDLRHSMVSHRMRDWYKAGINPQSKLPYLASFLGHKDITSTLVYLNVTPEILQQASDRFRQTVAQALRAAGEAS